jgi:hypothetical protein
MTSKWLNSFTVQVVISIALLTVCLTNVLTKSDSSLQWEKTIIASIFAYWTQPPASPK